MKRTKYEILGVEYSSSLEEIKHAFREKVKTLHPDESGGNSDARNEELLAVLEAYEILKDEEKRNTYNKTLTAEELERINLGKNKRQENKVTYTKSILLRNNHIKSLIVRTFYDDAVAIKYVLGKGNKLCYYIKNYQNSKETYVENDCYNRYFKDGLFTKKHPVADFFIGGHPMYTPLIREEIENRILFFKNDVYLARSDSIYRKIGQKDEFEIENGFIYHKESGASLFYDSFEGTLLDITGLLDWPFEKKQIAENKTKVKKKLTNKTLTGMSK